MRSCVSQKLHLYFLIMLIALPWQLSAQDQLSLKAGLLQWGDISPAAALSGKDIVFKAPVTMWPAGDRGFVAGTTGGVHPVEKTL
jgi:hypothetical protein